MPKQRKMAATRIRTALLTRERTRIFRTTKHCLRGVQTKTAIGLSREARIEAEITGKKASKWLLHPTEEHTESVT